MTPENQIAAQARRVGLKTGATATLEAVERRRGQLWILAGIIITGLAAGMVLLSIDSGPIEFLQTVLPGYIIRVLIVGFALSLGLYLMDKELKLRSLTKALLEERVLSAALSNRLKEISLLLEVGKAINQVLDTDSVLQMILRAAADLLNAEECSIMLLDDESNELVVRYAMTTDDRALVGFRVKIGEGISGTVAQTREPALITGRASSERYKKLAQKQRPPNSAMSVPLVGKERLYGVLNINDVTGTREFTEYDLRALGLFAEHAAIALGNARLFEAEKEAVVRLGELDQMKSEFIATVSHELRTPLTSIIGCAKTVRRRADVLSIEQRNEFLELIENQGEKLLRMVEEILSASRIESGRETLRREEIDLVPMAQTLIKEFEMAGAKTPLEISASDPEIIMYGDPIAMDQIISNLIENAVKYSETATPVKIRLDQEPGLISVSVTDQGKGISSEDLPTIFERFRQLDQSTTRTKGGVGLGLYLVRRLVEAQGGSIAVESEPGVGSKFTVTFPQRKERAD